MNKRYSIGDVKNAVQEILRQMHLDNFRPDYVVGITRGGLLPAKMISHYLKVPMYTLDISLRDNVQGGPESNLWMPCDAFGAVDPDDVPIVKKGDSVYYDAIAGHDIAYNDTMYRVIRARDIVIVE